jgi:predicted exporter
MKNIAIVLVALVLGILAWVLLHSSDIAVTVNGQKLVGPAKLAAEGWGVLVAIVSLVCAAILLVFVSAGTGLLILGVLVIAGFVAAWSAFPFLLPLLIPLFLVWIFVAAVRASRK